MSDYSSEKQSRKLWQIPAYSPSGENKKEVHEAMLQHVKDGLDFLELSPGACELEENIRILTGKSSGDLETKQGKGYSKAQTKRIKRNIREMVNSLSEIKYNPGYHSKNNDFHNFAATLNSVGEDWWMNSFADLQVKKAVQWCAITPCGWLQLVHHEVPGLGGERKTELDPMSWFSVVMTGVPDDKDYQKAYTVTIIKDLPVYLAHATFPDHVKELKPDRETPVGWIERIKVKAEQAFNKVFEQSPGKETAKNPTVRIYYQFVIDLSLNKSKKEMKMGYEKRKKTLAPGIEQDDDVETPWSYTVPFVGGMVPTGYDSNGTPTFRMAEKRECRVFKGRRLLIGTDKELIYDGPNFDWYPGVPLIKICADPWVFGDLSMMHDLVPQHEVINEIDRISHQTLRNRFDPTLLYNNRALPHDKAKTIRADQQGQRIGYNGQEVGSGGPMQPLFPKEFNVIEAWVESFRKYLMDDMDYESGVRNFEALAKLKLGAGAGGDFIDDALKGVGPIVKGIGRDMERSFRDLAEMFKYYVLQYMTSPELMFVIGPDQMTPVNFDYQPGNLIPSHLPGENKSKLSVYSNMERARWAADHVKFIVMPGTLHEITQTKTQMMYLQLWQKGFPISPPTLASVLHLGNYGKVDGADEVEKYFNWKKKELLMMAELAELKKKLFGDEGGEGAEPNAKKLGPRGGPKGTGGRASTGQKPPELKSKGDGRQTVTES